MQVITALSKVVEPCPQQYYELIGIDPELSAQLLQGQICFDYFGDIRAEGGELRVAFGKIKEDIPYQGVPLDRYKSHIALPPSV